MAAMAFVTQAWHVLALRAVHGLFDRLRRAVADDGRRVGAAATRCRAIGPVQTAQRLGPAVGP